MTVDAAQQVAIPAGELTTLAVRIFQLHGVSLEDASVTSDVLVEADLRGHASHGVVRIPKWADGLKAGAINARCSPSIISESTSSAWMDGDLGLGPVVASAATRVAARKARETGCGLVSVRRASHIGMLQFYAESLALDRLIGIVMTNTESGVAPYGGVDKLLGTNPISIGVPAPDHPVVLDMSTSQVARGKIVVAKNRDQQIPEGWAINSKGESTRDPVEALAGALLPVGGAKGAGLAIMVDLLTGALSGAAVGAKVRGTYDMNQEPTKGDLFIAIDPSALAGLKVFQERVQDLRSQLRASRVAKGHERILLPGEFELENRERHLSGGIPMDLGLLKQLRGLAREAA